MIFCPVFVSDNCFLCTRLFPLFHNQVWQEHFAALNSGCDVINHKVMWCSLGAMEREAHRKRRKRAGRGRDWVRVRERKRKQQSWTENREGRKRSELLFQKISYKFCGSPQNYSECQCWTRVVHARGRRQFTWESVQWNKRPDQITECPLGPNISVLHAHNNTYSHKRCDPLPSFAKTFITTMRCVERPENSWTSWDRKTEGQHPHCWLFHCCDPSVTVFMVFP